MLRKTAPNKLTEARASFRKPKQAGYSLLAKSNAQVKGRKKPNFKSLEKSSQSKKPSKNSKKYHLIRLLLTTLLAIIVVALVWSGYCLVKFINSNSPTQLAQIKQPGYKEWQGDTNLNVLVIGVKKSEANREFWESISLLSFHPESTEVNIINIDPELSVNIVENYPGSLSQVKTTYQYRQLYNYYLAQSQLDPTIRNPISETLRTIEADLGIKIDHYFKVDAQQYFKIFKPFYWQKIDQQQLSLESQFDYAVKASVSDSESQKLSDSRLTRQGKLLKTYLQNVTSIPVSAGLLLLTWIEPKLSNYYETTLSNTEILRLYLCLRNIQPYQITTISTSSKYIFLLGENKFLDPKLFDNQIQKNSSNLNLKIEQSRIDVINGSTRRGLAGSTSRLLQNFGLTVVRLDNSKELYVHNTIFSKELKKFPETVKLLERLYPDLEIKEYDYPYRPTGDIVLVVI